MKMFLVIIAALFLIVSSCGKNSVNSAKNPKDIGVHVMQILNEMEELTPLEFSKYFISHEELKGISEDKSLKIKDEQRRMMLAETPESLKVSYDFMCQRLKNNGKRLEMNWEKVTFFQFDFEIKDRGGVKFCYGDLTFGDHDRIFSVKTNSIYDGEKYLLTSVGEISQLIR